MAVALAALILWKLLKLAFKVVVFVVGVLSLGLVVALYMKGAFPRIHGDVPTSALPPLGAPG